MSSYRVFAADLSKDREVIIALWRRNLKDIDRLEEKFEWHFVNDPSGEGRCWLLEADGEPVGTTSLGMRRLKIADEIITVGIACDLAVERKHRFLQPALMLQQALLASIKPPIRMVYGFPGSSGAGVLQRAGYRPLCFVDRYAKVLQPSSYLHRNVRLAPLARAIGGALDGAYVMFSSVRERVRGNYIAEFVSDFDARFDELWQRSKDRYRALTVRDSSFLRWRYRDCPLRNYRTIGLLSPDRSRLFGYLIYYIEDKHAICADVFAENGADALRCLLYQWIESARRDSVSALSIRCSADPALRESLQDLYFVRRTEPECAPQTARNIKEPSRALLAYEQPASSALHSAGQWYFTTGDQPYN